MTVESIIDRLPGSAASGRLVTAKTTLARDDLWTRRRDAHPVAQLRARSSWKASFMASTAARSTVLRRVQRHRQYSPGTTVTRLEALRAPIDTISGASRTRRTCAPSPRRQEPVDGVRIGRVFQGRVRADRGRDARVFPDFPARCRGPGHLRRQGHRLCSRALPARPLPPARALARRGGVRQRHRCGRAHRGDREDRHQEEHDRPHLRSPRAARFPRGGPRVPPIEGTRRRHPPRHRSRRGDLRLRGPFSLRGS